MTETESYFLLSTKIGKSWRYKNKVLFFKELKNVPTGRFTILTDGMTITFFHNEAKEFLENIVEAPTQYKPERIMMPAQIKPKPQPQPKPVEKINYIDKETMEIKESMNYDKFKSITGNRSLNHRKIDKIVNDIKHGFNMLQFCPVIVSVQGDDMMIIDGQHRAEISKKTNNPIYYVECEQLTLKQIAQLNSRGEKWTPADFLNCYVRLGINDYLVLQNIVNNYNIGIITAADFLANWYLRGKILETFQDGNFKVQHRQKVVALLDLAISVFGPTSPYINDRKILTAIQRISEKGVCDFERMRVKVEQNPGMMGKEYDAKKYCQMLENVYNVRSQIRQTIY